MSLLLASYGLDLCADFKARSRALFVSAALQSAITIGSFQTYSIQNFLLYRPERVIGLRKGCVHDAPGTES